MQKPFKTLLSLLAGVALVFAFSPFGIRFLAILSPALLLWCLLDTNKKTAFAHGLFFGCGFFGAGAYWIYISIHTFGEAPLAISLLITTLFILALSLFTAFSTYLFSCFKTSLSFRCLALFPSIWVLAEWLRSWVLTGFPWLFLGYSQVDTQLRVFAPIVGVYGLSFLLVFISGMLIVLIKGARREKYMMLALLGLIWLSTKGLSNYTYTTALPTPISTSLIQGNIPQSLKWDAEQAAKTLKTYEELNHTQMPHTLIVWPEAAIPVFKSQARQYLNRLNTHLKQKDQILITGIPIDQWPNFYNGILMLGIAQGEYFKIHLVPFGEYYPLKWLVSPLFDYLKIPMSDLTPGPNAQPLLDAHGLSIAPFVCYEVAYPQQVLTQAKQAELLITLTDDSWFGNSVAASKVNIEGTIRTYDPQIRERVIERIIRLANGICSGYQCQFGFKLHGSNPAVINDAAVAGTPSRTGPARPPGTSSDTGRVRPGVPSDTGRVRPGVPFDARGVRPDGSAGPTVVDSAAAACEALGRILHP